METSRTILYSGVRNTYSALLVSQASLPDNRPRDMQYDSASLVRQKRFPVILISRRFKIQCYPKSFKVVIGDACFMHYQTISPVAVGDLCKLFFLTNSPLVLITPLLST